MFSICSDRAFAETPRIGTLALKLELLVSIGFFLGGSISYHLISWDARSPFLIGLRTSFSILQQDRGAPLRAMEIGMSGNVDLHFLVHEDTVKGFCGGTQWPNPLVIFTRLFV